MHAEVAADDTAWASALARLPDELRDIYFTPAYHRLHDSSEASARCSVIEEGAGLLVVPGLATQISGEPGRFDLQTPNGYGGPLADGELSLERAWNAWRAEVKQQGMVAAFFRLHPLIDNARFLPADATVVDDRQTVWIALDRGLDAAMRAAESQFRNKVTRSLKAGLEVRWNLDEDWQPFQVLYADAMERLGASPALRFSPEYFARLRALAGVEWATLRDAQGLVAAAVFLQTPRFSHYHLGARRADADNHLMSFVFYRAMERAAERGLAGLHLGGGATPAPDDPLLRFKRRFSDRLLRYRVARVIVDAPLFNQWIDAWRARAGHPPAWLLGYRQPLPQGAAS